MHGCALNTSQSRSRSFHQFFRLRFSPIAALTGAISLASIPRTTASSAPARSVRPYCTRGAAASVASRILTCGGAEGGGGTR
eukprot:4830572-Prymnesium_polylepis.1